MNNTKRLSEMEKFIFEQRHTTLQQLSKQMNVSINTVRRDLEVLLSWGAVKKVYGGVVSNPQYHYYLHHGDRSEKNIDNKKKIGIKATSFLSDNDIVIIDSGSTTSEFIEQIDNNMPLTIITNSLKAIEKFSLSSTVKLICLGGEYQPNANGFASFDTVDSVKHYKANKLFLSITGLYNTEDGITNATSVDSGVKRAMIEIAKEVYLLVDSSKFGVISPMVITSYSRIDYLITDKMPPKEYLDLLQANNIELVIA